MPESALFATRTRRLFLTASLTHPVRWTPPTEPELQALREHLLQVNARFAADPRTAALRLVLREGDAPSLSVLRHGQEVAAIPLRGDACISGRAAHEPLFGQAVLDEITLIVGELGYHLIGLGRACMLAVRWDYAHPPLN